MDVLHHLENTAEQPRLGDHALWQTLPAAGGAVVGCLLALMPALRILQGGAPRYWNLDWDAAHGTFAVGWDALSAFFLLPILCLSPLAAVYGGNYLLVYRREKNLGVPWFFFGVFVAGMVMVVSARTVLLFLLSWEVMSLAAYFLVTFEHEKPAARQAGWIYLIATHCGVVFLFVAFLLLGRQAGSLAFEAFAKMPPLDAGMKGLIFVLALVGFGAKAGLFPFHVWLPEAHPAAPSHVSALMSGVMINMGLYGLLRVLTFLGPPAPWWGPALAGIGLVSALTGIALALYQRDLKRVLAYSSIENMGLIALAMGMSLWGLANHFPAVAALGMTAALLHVWNHSLMKGLMFFAAGSVLHATGTKDMERQGGLMRRMPWTGATMLSGAVALAALPPMNGFSGKWLMYLGLIKCGLTQGDSRGPVALLSDPSLTLPARGLVALLAVGLLALIGGLAAIAYVRLIGIVLLGSPRSEAASRAHESSPWMLGPMVVLLALCLTVAVVPRQVVGLMSGVLDQVLGLRAGGALLALEAAEAPLAILGNINAWTFITIGLTAGVLRVLTRPAVREKVPTWGCGYVQPTQRMQYTGRSFAEMLAERLLPRFLRPRTSRQAPRGLFPEEGTFASACPDPVSAKVYEPLFARWANRFGRLRVLQQGKVHVYLTYLMLMVVLALAWVSLHAWWEKS